MWTKYVELKHKIRLEVYAAVYCAIFFLILFVRCISCQMKREVAHWTKRKERNCVHTNRANIWSKWKKNRRNNRQTTPTKEGCRIATDRERDGQISKAHQVNEKQAPNEIEKVKERKKRNNNNYIHTHAITNVCTHTYEKKKGRIESSARIHIIKYIIHIIRERDVRM